MGGRALGRGSAYRSSSTGHGGQGAGEGERGEQRHGARGKEESNRREMAARQQVKEDEGCHCKVHSET
eukprot:12035699-Alexandrium_andersonii.AAC.1